jgi:hypothetical protein
LPVGHIAGGRIAAHSPAMGPNDIFEISSNNPPDLPDDDEDGPAWDEMGDYPLESDEGNEE